MSRQKGRRTAPKPQHDAYVHSLTTRGRRTRPPAPLPGAPITPARRWGAVGVATFLLLFSFAGVVTAIVEDDRGNTSNARSAVILAVIIAPLAIYLLGLISRAPTPLRTAALVAPATMAAFTLLAALLREPATAVVAAFGVGGAFVLRLEEGTSVVRRISVAGMLAILTLVAYRFVPDVMIVIAPLLPFTGCAVADKIPQRASAATPE